METKESSSPELLRCFGFLQPKVHGAGTEYLRVVCSAYWVLSPPSPENQLAKRDIFSYPLGRVLVWEVRWDLNSPPCNISSGKARVSPAVK